MKKILFFLVACFVSLLFILPVFDFTNGQFFLIQGDDYPFHFARIFSIMDQLNSNNNYTPISLFGNQQILYGVDLFYPILTTALPIAVFSTLFHSVILGIYTYIFLVNLLTFILAFYTCRYVVKKIFLTKPTHFYFWSAFIFAIFYVFSHYRLICFYTRIDLGEFFSLSMYPLIFAGFFSIIKEQGKHRNWLIIGLVGIAYSHILSLFLSVVFLSLLFVLSVILKYISFKEIKQFLISGLITIALTAPVLFPLIYEMLTLTIRSVKTHNLSSEAYSLVSIIEHSLTNQLNYKSMGIVLFLTLCIASWLFFKPKATLIKNNPFLIFCLIVCLLLTLSLSKTFPWPLLQLTPLSIIQFPFRLMAFLSVFGYFLTAILFTNWIIQKKQPIQLSILSLLFILFGLTYLNVHGLIAERHEKPLFYTANDIQQSERYQKSVNKDYFPANLSKKQTEDIVKKIGYINNQASTIDYANQSLTFTLTVDKQTNEIITPIIAYSGLELINQENETITTYVSSAKTLAFQLPKGTYTLSIRYQMTTIQKISLVIAAIGFFILCFTVIQSYLISNKQQIIDHK